MNSNLKRGEEVNNNLKKQFDLAVERNNLKQLERIQRENSLTCIDLFKENN